MLIISLKIHTKVTQSILCLTFSMYLRNHTMFKLHWAMMIGLPSKLAVFSKYVNFNLFLYVDTGQESTPFFFLKKNIAVKKREVFNMCATKPDSQPNNDHCTLTFFSWDCQSITLKGLTSSIKVHCTWTYNYPCEVMISVHAFKSQTTSIIFLQSRLSLLYQYGHTGTATLVHYYTSI